MILAGDVGGTKVHLALYNFADGKLSPVRDQKFPAHEYASLDDVVKKFLGPEGDRAAEDLDSIAAACFGCPGPVRDGRLKLTNLPWMLDARLLQTSVGIEHIFLINDLEANGYGIPELSRDAIFALHTGDAANPAQEAETLRASLAIRANAAPVSPAAPEVAAQELDHARWQHVKLPKSRSASRGMASQPIDVQT